MKITIRGKDDTTKLINIKIFKTIFHNGLPTQERILCFLDETIMRSGAFSQGAFTSDQTRMQDLKDKS